MTKRLNILVIVILFALMFAAEYLPSRLFSAQRQVSSTTATQAKVIRFGDENSFSYNPASVTIKAGQAVLWQGQFGTHPLASDTQLWTPPHTGDTFSYTFKNPGSYRFYCEIHGAPGGYGMTGIVIVQ